MPVRPPALRLSIPFFALLICGSLCSLNVWADPEIAPPQRDAQDVTFFNDEVLPILQKRCLECHSHAAGKAKGGLMLDSRQGWVTGGDSGTAIVPGNLEDSPMIRAVRYVDVEMPPNGRLPPEEIAVLERWVSGGAVDPRKIDVAHTEGGIDLAKGREHWAFQPLRHEAVPDVKHADWPLDPLDRFLLARLEQQGLQPVEDADRYTWLRRVSLDLTGVPPSPEQIEDFVADQSPQAQERVVDRLLASRAYGERWARHWLDLVGYADEIGTSNNIFAEHAWRYRDYVIDAFNDDMPFDQFVREQLAGDMLPFDSAEQHASQVVATGFLILGDLTIVEADKAKLQIDVVDQQVDKFSRAFLAMTVACARCHDHKFDPIPQQDYYALAGIFNSTQSVHKASWGVWSWPTVVELPETVAQQADREAKAALHAERIENLKTEQRQSAARKTEIDAALKAENAVPADVESLEKERKQLDERLKQLPAEIRHAEFFAPRIPQAFAACDSPEPKDMQITIRGNAHALGKEVPRGFLQVVSIADPPVVSSQSSGRRELAEWIVRPDNPLTARVTVNRIWQRLFGEGIVRSVDYFGVRGEQPTHPELLDHLASRFRNDGWSQKRLIKSIVLSRAYRMSSRHDAVAFASDPGNRLLWRMNRRRVDAESLRDSLLATSGKLLDSQGGPSLPLEILENTGGLGKGEVNPPNFRLKKFRPEQQFVRSIYLPIIRDGRQAGPAELLNVFDFTQPAEFAGQRNVTSVPTQALFLMNAKLMRDRAGELADQVLSQHQDETERLGELWLRAFSRPIAPDEVSTATSFLHTARQDQNGQPPDQTDRRAWKELCHALLASNEFLMRL
ncbi:PSD1 and planctomycete cytochrome C domain-containing protein [Planctomicrobium piriforme]|uniref:Planctomycete cytochrome C n=1 Tax=Planctomicrobium piriforme TaxID=1576369 RepID=A0A1I3CG00_9PLAN|nr:PSD1 and planctomycete cytochrome C domain-containing protein [Planctomicrobium piriforme]SFH73296.1 Planctomycete cytochrome C [Planctomicrobium piriforme]